MNQQSPDPAQIQHLMMLAGPMIFGFGLVFLGLLVLPYWFIFKKAGFPAPLALLMFIPLINLIMLYVLAFSRWKVIPAPEYGSGYPPNYPPPGYAPPAGYMPPAGYGAQPGHVAPTATGSGYVPPNTPPTL